VANVSSYCRMDMAEVKCAWKRRSKKMIVWTSPLEVLSYNHLRPNRVQCLVLLLYGIGVSIDPIAPLEAVAPLEKSVGDVESSSPSPNRSGDVPSRTWMPRKHRYCCWSVRLVAYNDPSRTVGQALDNASSNPNRERNAGWCDGNSILH
jgi:hypothetical protein